MLSCLNLLRYRNYYEKFFLLFFVTLFLSQKGESMNYSTETRGEKYVVGIAVRTENADGKCQKDATALWSRFYSEGVLEKISNKTSSCIFGLYTEYEGDFTKPFTYLIGCEVSSLDQIPEGMQGVVIDASKYAVFTGYGPLPGCVVEAWKEVWNAEVKRAYTVDFELYKPEQLSEVQVYIALDPA